MFELEDDLLNIKKVERQDRKKAAVEDFLEDYDFEQGTEEI